MPFLLIKKIFWKVHVVNVDRSIKWRLFDSWAMMCFARFTFLLTLLATAGAFIFVRVDNLQIVISGSNSYCRVQRSYTCLGWTLLRILEIFRVVDNILSKDQNHLRIPPTRGSGRLCQYSLVHPLEIKNISGRDVIASKTFYVVRHLLQVKEMQQ